MGPPRAVEWIPTPQEEPPAPKFAYLASSWRSCAPSWHQDATTSPKIVKKNHLGAKSSNMAPKTLPRQPPEPFRGGPNPKKLLKSDGGLIVFTLRSFFQKSQKVTKNLPRTLPKAPKLSPRWPSWRHHGASWAQLAANLAHLASILGPSSSQLH